MLEPASAIGFAAARAHRITVRLTRREARRVRHSRRGLAAIVTSRERDRTGLELVRRKIRVKRAR